MDRPSLYDDDIVTWSEEQAAALRALAARRDLSNSVDWANVAEEIESVGRSHIFAVQNLLIQVLKHVLKRLSTPGSPATRHWHSEILTFQKSARDHFSWSMRQRLDLEDLWTTARKIAAAESIAYGDALLPNVPERCPLQLADLVANPFDADAALQKIAGAATS